MVILESKQTEFYENKLSENVLENRFLNCFKNGFLDFEDICFFNNYLGLSTELYNSEGLVYKKKEIAVFMNNFKLWRVMLENKNARRIISKLYNRNWSEYALSKELKLSHLTTRYWFNKLKMCKLICLDHINSYGNENLFRINIQDFPSFSKFLINLMKMKELEIIKKELS